MQGVDGKWFEVDPDGEYDRSEECSDDLGEEGPDIQRMLEDLDGQISCGAIQINGAGAAQTITIAPESRLGWECPRCHGCHAPHVNSCPNCQPQAAQPVVNPSPYIYPTTFPNVPVYGDGVEWGSGTVKYGDGLTAGASVCAYTISDSCGADLDVDPMFGGSSCEVHVSADQSE